MRFNAVNMVTIKAKHNYKVNAGDMRQLRIPASGNLLSNSSSAAHRLVALLIAFKTTGHLLSHLQSRPHNVLSLGLCWDGENIPMF